MTSAGVTHVKPRSDDWPRNLTVVVDRMTRAAVLILCSIGLMLCSYAFYVETRKEHDSKYLATCDISESISCSKVFTSRYGRGFGLVELVFGKDSRLNVPNSIFGFIFYILQIILECIHSKHAIFLQIVMSVLSNCGSVYLGYILYYVLHDFCVVCVSIYVVNFLVLSCNIVRKVNSSRSSSVKLSGKRDGNKKAKLH